MSEMTPKKHNFCKKKKGLQHNGVFYQSVCCKMSKVIVFWGAFFLAIFCLIFKKHYKIGILALFSKQKITKRMAFLNVIIWSKLSVIIWSKLGAS